MAWCLVIPRQRRVVDDSIGNMSASAVDGNDPISIIAQQHQRILDSLPFADTRDFDDAQRGFIARREPCVIRAEDGRVAWDNDSSGFLEGDAPAPVNPSLWRMSKLNAIQLHRDGHVDQPDPGHHRKGPGRGRRLGPDHPPTRTGDRGARRRCTSCFPISGHCVRPRTPPARCTICSPCAARRCATRTPGAPVIDLDVTYRLRLRNGVLTNTPQGRRGRACPGEHHHRQERGGTGRRVRRRRTRRHDLRRHRRARPVDLAARSPDPDFATVTS